MTNQPETVGNKFLRYFMMIVGIAVGTTVVKQCNKKTPQDNWNDLAAAMKKDASQMFQDDSSRVLFTNCLVDKFKRKYPNGVDGMSQDTINSNARTFGAECGSELKGRAHFNISWSSEIVIAFKENLLKTPLVSNIPENKKSDFCDCFLQKIKQRYPDGLRDQIPATVEDTVYFLCKKQLSIK